MKEVSVRNICYSHTSDIDRRVVGHIMLRLHILKFGQTDEFWIPLLIRGVASRFSWGISPDIYGCVYQVMLPPIHIRVDFPKTATNVFATTLNLHPIQSMRLN